MPDESRIVPWGVQSIDHEDIDFWQGRLDGDLVDETIAALVEDSVRCRPRTTRGGEPAVVPTAMT
jgi:hypothetical protein